MSSENSVTAARSALALAVRNSGDPDEIAIARDRLAVAKAERLRSDAQAILEGRFTDETRIIGYSDEGEIPRALHDALWVRQQRDVDEFKASHGPTRDWTDAVRNEYADLLTRHRKAHRSLGCSALSACAK